MDFSEKLRTERRRARLTQRKLAQLCGVSLRTVTNYETGRNLPRGDMQYRKLAQVLNIDMMSLKAPDSPSARLTDKNSACAAKVQTLFILFSQILEEDTFSDHSKDLLMYSLMQRYWNSKGYKGL